jgi:hypothetical protein
MLYEGSIQFLKLSRSLLTGDDSGKSFGDGEPAANNPIGNAAGGLAIDTSGNVFIADDVDNIILKVIA